MDNKIAILDAKVIADNETLKMFEQFGKLTIWHTTKPEERLQHIGDANIIITNKVVFDKAIFDSCSKLKLICLTATGMNNVDLEYAKQKGVEVKNVAGYSTESVAQHTFTMLFYLLGQPAYYDNYVKSGQYAQSDVFCHFGLKFWELKGKRWGIIGLGAIGRRVAEIAAAFGCDVVYYSTSGQNNCNDYKKVELEELLSTSWIISIHAPLNDKTQNLLSFKEFENINKNAVLINVGRGPIVNCQALAKAIDKGLIAGACLDVLPNEPIEHNNPLMNITHKEKLLITPHIAWTSQEAINQLLLTVKSNIQNYISLYLNNL